MKVDVKYLYFLYFLYFLILNEHQLIMVLINYSLKNISIKLYILLITLLELYVVNLSQNHLNNSFH
jgi:hypothetical protein